MKTHHYTSPITATTTTSAANTYGKRFSRPFSRREGVGAGIFLRRVVRYLLLVSLLYISALIICMGPFSFLMRPRPLPGSVYRSHEIFLKLWDDIQADNSSKIEISTLWRYKRKLKEQKPCPRTSRRKLGYSRRGYYLIVEANGGLNQQRSSICNAVAVAALLNAILVIPHFEVHSVWNDPSQFSDIYDAEHFINTVKPYVKVVRRLPPEWMEVYDFNISNIPYYRVPAWSTTQYYLDIVQPVLNKKRVMRIAPFANRLAMNVPPNIQFLRCLSNYEALRFSSAISILAKKLITQMIDKSSRTGGKYISVHLRFEEDMVAFSCCEYDGGRAEKIQMDSIRQKGWGEKFKRKADVIEPGLNRINGRCPMTPLEVGMMLRGMGFANDTPIYLAAGTIYQAGKNLAPLLKMFPLLQTKESLAVPEELAPFKDYSSRLAALDYMVCLASEVFVTTQGGNFPHFLMGHRRFIYGGHAKTVKPDKSQLAFLLRDTNISWTAFKNQMEVMLAESDRKGKLVISGGKKSNRKNSIFSNPFPECNCLMEMKNMTFKQTHTFLPE